MKKNFSALVLLSILVFLLLPVIVTAIRPPEECVMDRTIELKEFTCRKDETIRFDDEKAICCLLNTLYNVTDWIFVFLVALATIFVIVGAFFLLTSAGVPEKQKAGREYIIFAAIGLAAAFFARAVPYIVKLVTGVQ
jgi:uncharacterized protein YpmS